MLMISKSTGFTLTIIFNKCVFFKQTLKKNLSKKSLENEVKELFNIKRVYYVTKCSQQQI